MRQVPSVSKLEPAQSASNDTHVNQMFDSSIIQTPSYQNWGLSHLDESTAIDEDIPANIFRLPRIDPIGDSSIDGPPATSVKTLHVASDIPDTPNPSFQHDRAHSMLSPLYSQTDLTGGMNPSAHNAFRGLPSFEAQAPVAPSGQPGLAYHVQSSSMYAPQVVSSPSSASMPSNESGYTYLSPQNENSALPPSLHSSGNSSSASPGLENDTKYSRGQVCLK